MKKSLRLLFVIGFITAASLFTSCIQNPEEKPNEKETENKIPEKVELTEEDVNPIISDTASVSQDFIFNTESVGFTTLTIRRSEWNKMLQYYDYFYKNENSVIAESYEYTKDGKSWKLNQVGLRLRGNTSRFRPQGRDSATDKTNHTKPNASWSQDYYNYAAFCSKNDYRQSHFKVDFEPKDDDDRKMSNCMKGVALKRSDSVFSSEIFCYKLFHLYGIWTAPRASQTKVYIKFIEDVNSNGTLKDDISNCKVTKVDFGVYEMFEEVNKQSLKGRMKKKDNNTAENAWENNDGDLWKCSGGDLTASSNNASNFGVEQVEILHTDKNESEWKYVWYNPCYDLKTNKTKVDAATVKFQSFISELNNLSSIDQFTQEGIDARKGFYEKWFDVDFFIKTYAVNMLVGMDDDYWGNANNYYLYFDNGKNGNGKCYFIPFDYDNTLGKSITGDKVYTNPFEWGNGKDRPLLDRLLEVPEYVTKMKNALLEVSSQDADSPWNKNNCFDIWNSWHAQVRPYVGSDDIKGWPNISSLSVDDSGGWKSVRHYLTRDYSNLYEQVTDNFRKWLLSEAEVKFDLNGGSLNGETKIKTVSYNGKPKFEDMIGIPKRSDYEFVGWTKTKDGKDYIDSFNGEENLTVYASWIYVKPYKNLTILEVPDECYEGIKIVIINLPEDHYRRTFKIDGKEVGGDSADNPEKYKKIWAYPFTEPGKTYSIEVSYSTEGYSWLEDSNKLVVTAESGIGEFKLLNKPEYYIENNILKWKTEPVIQLGDGKAIREDSNWDEYYLLEVQSTRKANYSSWNYQSWNYLGATCNNNFNFKEHVKEDVLNGTRYDLCFRLKYNYNSSPYGDLCLVIFDWGPEERFNIE